jgi:hypothetical protein
MHWKTLVQASEIYRQREPAYIRFYFEYMSLRHAAAWDSDAGPSGDEIGELFTFLNRFAARYASDADARGRFKKAYLEVLPLLRAIRGHTLVDTRFHDGVAGGKSVSEAVDWIFDKIASSGRRYESTATSKILHVLYPPLFIMWESAIRGGYAVGGRSRDYAERFLPLMQREATEAVGSYIADGNAGPTTAVQEVERLCGARPLTKLIDEYNYCKFRLRADGLWR